MADSRPDRDRGTRGVTHSPAWDDARAIAGEAGSTLPAEVVSLEQSHNRRLAHALTALCDLPGFDTSAMDGWAVSGPGPWSVVGKVLAGSTPERAVPEGIPHGADLSDLSFSRVV